MDDIHSFPHPHAADSSMLAAQEHAPFAGYEYRCVAAPAVVTVRRARERMKSVEALEETLNREAREGWEYVGIDELAIVEPAGFFSRRKQRTSFKVIVFRRPR